MIVGVDSKSASWHAVGRAAWMPGGHMLSKHVAKRGSLDSKRQEIEESFDAFLAAAVVLAELRQETAHVFFEHPLALANGKTTLALGMAAGALWAAHLKHDLWWHWTEVSSWAAMVGVNGLSTKERKAGSKAYAMEHAGLPDGLDEDHYDAANVALWGERELARLPEGWRPESIAGTDRP